MAKPKRQRKTENNENITQRLQLSGHIQSTAFLKQTVNHIFKGIDHFKNARQKNYFGLKAGILLKNNIKSAYRQHQGTSNHPGCEIKRKRQGILHIGHLVGAHVEIADGKHHLSSGICKGKNTGILQPDKARNKNEHQRRLACRQGAGDNVPSKRFFLQVLIIPQQQLFQHGFQTPIDKGNDFSVFPPAAAAYNRHTCRLGCHAYYWGSLNKYPQRAA